MQGFVRRAAAVIVAAQRNALLCKFITSVAYQVFSQSILVNTTRVI